MTLSLANGCTTRLDVATLALGASPQPRRQYPSTETSPARSLRPSRGRFIPWLAEQGGTDGRRHCSGHVVARRN